MKKVPFISNKKSYSTCNITFPVKKIHFPISKVKEIVLKHFLQYLGPPNFVNTLFSVHSKTCIISTGPLKKKLFDL